MQEEVAAGEQRQAAVRAAIQILSDARHSNPPQIVARLPQVSKSRNIRIGHAAFELDKLAFLIFLILVAIYGIMALEYVSHQSLAQREDRALTLVTEPDVSPIHLVPEDGFASGVRGTYWGKSGAETAMLTLSNTAPVPEGARYRW